MPSTSGEASSYSARPSGVSAIRGPRRSNSTVLISCSRALIWSETEGWLRCTRSAALEMLCVRTAWQNARSCLSRFCL